MNASSTGRPLSVAVFGASVTLLVTGPRPDGELHLNYPAVLARHELDGTRFDVTTHARIYGLVKDFSGIWANPLAKDRPDVVVLQFGLGEAFPRIVPRALTMFLLGQRRHSSRVRDRLWRHARRALMTIHSIERTVDAHLPLSWSRMPVRRFESELNFLCTRIREQVGSRLVLMTAYPATPPTPFLTPKLLRRVDAVNAAILRVAAAQNATVFPLDDIVAAQGPGALPDGLHMTVDIHRVVGEHLAECLVRTAVRQVA
ncbi:MAG: SGNH/GDSL hydrolase family protein [Frankiaceae bacterium]|nr:SGNH/GDSL hydrolase family protein [Frankiaceae bacterium]MBV9369632.1 SGNH/GDSL hydrolase family protein [Frankiales bacterium]